MPIIQVIAHIFFIIDTNFSLSFTHTHFLGSTYEVADDKRIQRSSRRQAHTKEQQDKRSSRTSEAADDKHIRSSITKKKGSIIFLLLFLRGLLNFLFIWESSHSSDGRAKDCSELKSKIFWSLVQFQLRG